MFGDLLWKGKIEGDLRVPHPLRKRRARMHLVLEFQNACEKGRNRL